MHHVLYSSFIQARSAPNHRLEVLLSKVKLEKLEVFLRSC